MRWRSSCRLSPSRPSSERLSGLEITTRMRSGRVATGSVTAFSDGKTRDSAKSGESARRRSDAFVVQPLPKVALHQTICWRKLQSKANRTFSISASRGARPASVLPRTNVLNNSFPYSSGSWTSCVNSRVASLRSICGSQTRCHPTA